MNISLIGPRLAVLFVAVALLPLDVARACPSAGQAQDPDRTAQRVAPEPITQAPPFSSSVKSVEIVSVEFAEDQTGGVVRIKLRNVVDEAVIGLHFEIHGSDPRTWGGYGELAAVQESPPQHVIAPKHDHLVEIPAANFELGDKLRLSAVLFSSGRGEGEIEKVNEMRREATTIRTPPSPSVTMPNDAPN